MSSGSASIFILVGRFNCIHTNFALVDELIFGLGIANPTGIGLLIIMVIIFFSSLPIVRRTGHFELFYFAHYLYILYLILLIFHAPEFWKSFLLFGTIWMMEKIYRFVHMFLGKGRTIIEEGIVLPSNVTNLVIKRPPNFHFNAGDWIFINIPRIREAFKKKSINKVNVLICLDPLPPPPNKEKKIRKFFYYS